MIFFSAISIAAIITTSSTTLPTQLGDKSKYFRGSFVQVARSLQDIDIKGTAAGSSISVGRRHFKPTSRAELKSALSTCLRLSPVGHCDRGLHGPVGDWGVSMVTSMYDMFRGATFFNADISKWDMSRVTSMNGMFQSAKMFNGDISKWDVSKSTDLSYIFAGATSFNGDISKWDVAQATDVSYMFADAKSFKGDISKLDVSSARDMSYMFYDATSFNGQLSNWDVSSATNMLSMFIGATAFNSDISEWNVSSVTNMQSMFYEATSFDRIICGAAWTNSKASKDDMFTGSKGSMCAVCKCERGTPISGPLCTTNGATMCETCDDGYTINEDRTACVKTVATTPSATPIASNTTTAKTQTTIFGSPTLTTIFGSLAAIAGAAVAAGTAVAAALSCAATGAGAAAAGVGAAAAGVGATAAGAATGLGALAATATVTVSATGAAIALLAKYGLKPKSLQQTNILSPETCSKRMVSKEVIRVKHAPDMNLMESVRHFTFLLSKKNIQFVTGQKAKSIEKLKREIETFSEKIQKSIADFYSPQLSEEKTCDAGNAMTTCTADEATAMFQETSSRDSQNKTAESMCDIMTKRDRDKVIDKASRCLAWAQDPARPTVPGAENMTNDQAAAVMLYTQETCLYGRLNAALRDQDKRGLEPFLPFMKLLLSALYQLPLMHVRTYRGVKLELYETYNLLVNKVWCWRSFSSTTRNKQILLQVPAFFGTSGKRTMFCIKGVGVDIAPFSAMDEEEVLLLPGLPLINQHGKNPESDLWTFEVETPGPSVSGNGDSPPVMIDYVHPGWDALLNTFAGGGSIITLQSTR